MAKKYLSLEEAAEVLGIEPEALNQKREKRGIRAFSDRGSWKFRPEDVENLKRSMQVDSSKEADLSDASDDSEADFGATFADGDSGADIVLGDSGADMVLDDSEDSHDDEHSTIVRRREGDASSSDSDVKLVFDDALMSDGGSSEEISLSPLNESDSDVRLSADSSLDAGSDSDVKLVGGSSVEIEKLGSGSDSDVSLVGSSSDEGSGSGSDSDVQLIQTSENQAENFVAPPTNLVSEYDVSLGGDAPEDSEGSSVMAQDSGLSLDEDSGIALDSDSGIALESDSGLSLASDSGISLADDSGLSLAGDSGISLAGPDDSGISLDGGTDRTEAFSVIDDDSGDGHDTHLDVPAVVDEESDFEFSTNLLDTDSETSVITLDDDEEESVESAVFEDSEELDFGDDGLDDDVLGSSDAVDLIGADEEHFDDDMLTGESAAGLGVPSGRLSRPVEQEWGMATHIGLWIGSLTMIAGLLMMFDVVRTMWGNSNPDSVVQSGALIDFIAGLF
ncbi:hypothetical protein Pan258_37990 [Symmachiella dynata]|uniref:hypothetical protein n=1 Tax=Symmachiella dynata TaxID=2527995 RepID=UPI00118CFBC3|nr:hypothetical protein [Symmachiella dynata]QDT49744.1 hypothetical protein Pan258_37990 [Symmachiella dynata]